MCLKEVSWVMAAGKYLFCQLIVLFTMSVDFLQGNVTRPEDCLRGFAQTFPPEEEWDNYTALDQDGGIVLYPDVNVICDGVITEMIMPFSTTVGIAWDKELTLDVLIWRRERGRGHTVSGSSRKGRVTITNKMETTANIKGNITFSDVLVRNGDLLQISLPKYGRDDIRQHIPILTKEYQAPGGCGVGGAATIPLIYGVFQQSEGTVTANGSGITLSKGDMNTSDMNTSTYTTDRPLVVTTTATKPIAMEAGTGEYMTIIAGVLGAVSTILFLIIICLVIIIGILVVKGRAQLKGKNTCGFRVSMPRVKSENYETVIEHSELKTLEVMEMRGCVLEEETNEKLDGTLNQRGDHYQYNSIYATVTETATTNTTQPVQESGDTLLNEKREIDQTHNTVVEAIYDEMASRKYIQIPIKAIDLQEQLGEGEFGVVYKGQWMSATGRTQTVALKTLKFTASNDERVKLLQEAAIMGQFTHPHIVQMYGVVKEPETPAIVMEFIGGGELRDYLTDINKLKNETHLPATLLRFCQEIADGMRYLSQKGFIHRDLAARNVLLTADIKCKIADFGMSRNVSNYYYKTKGGHIPVKWTAPEAIFYNKYTIQSDVWSYGMVTYEIWSLGHKPFGEFTIEEFLRALNSGYTLPPPPGCPRGIYSIMLKCWILNPAMRPCFDDIIREFESNSNLILKWEDGKRVDSLENSELETT